MYANPETIDQETLYQGDIIADFPFFIFQDSHSVKKNQNGFFEQADNAEDGEENLFVVAAKKQSIMILSQTCDIQRRENIIICPVFKLADLISSKAINSEQAKSLRARKIYYNFYLPEFGDFPETIADLQTMIYVSREKLSTQIKKRIISLDHLGRHHLAWALTNYFGRPAETA